MSGFGARQERRPRVVLECFRQQLLARRSEFSPALKAQPDRKGQNNRSASYAPRDPAPLARYEFSPEHFVFLRASLVPVNSGLARGVPRAQSTQVRQKIVALAKRRFCRCPVEPSSLFFGRAAERDENTDSAEETNLSANSVFSSRRCTSAKRGQRVCSVDCQEC